MAIKGKITIDEITKRSKEEAVKNAESMKNPVVLPVYVAIDSDEHGVCHIANPSLTYLTGTEIVEGYSELDYHIYKSLRLDLIRGNVNDLKKGKEMIEEWINKERISGEAISEMNSRFDSEIQGTLPDYKAKNYLDDILGDIG